MSSNKTLALAALLAPALVIGSAYAAEPGFYIGASGGQTTVDQDAKDFGFNDNNLNNILVVNPLEGGLSGARDFKIDDNDWGWKAYLGYQFLPWLGVEAGYVDFGGVSNSFYNSAGGSLRTDVDLNGWEGFLVGTIPIGPVDLFAKVGAIDLKVDGKVNAGGPNIGQYQNSGSSENDTQLAYGVGAAYNFGKGHWGLRVEAEGYDDNEVEDFYFLSAGITYRFFHDKVEPVAAAAPVAAAPAKCADGDGDGVCDTVDQCPNTPPGTRVGKVGCDCDYTLTLEFAFDSAKLSPSDKAQLDKLAAVLAKPETHFAGGVIEGHTDSVGTDKYNMGLSKRRAESVASYLSSQGVNLGSRFPTEAFGESKPIASNDTAEGRAKNRRVVIRRTDCDSSSK
jgi:outer membrane protein OmpA-like peptidoglycan-associated protein